MCNYFVSLSPQVIYKKFNITCPLQTFANTSVSDSVPDDSCTTKYFTINPEVSFHLPDTRTREPPGVHTSPTHVRSLSHFQTAYAIPILAFAFVCHPEVLPIYTELSK